MSKPKVLILHADGTNRDHDAARAFVAAGADADIVHINQLHTKEKRWDAYQILALPGGFTYADALGSGKLWALDLNTYFKEEVKAFIDSGKPVIGICNGFQALVKAGLLPFPLPERYGQRATLTHNQQGRFECRWVTLKVQSQRCVWTRGLDDLIDCPVAHGEGNFTLRDPELLSVLDRHNQIVLTYSHSDGAPANGEYPINPNGSIGDIAGVCDPRGNVLGLMPHPENHIVAYQHPRWTRGACGRLGLKLFENGVRYAQEI